MVIVSDTTAITNLFQIGQLHLLEKLYGEILIPESVYDELANFHDRTLLSKLNDFNITPCSVPYSTLSEIIKAEKLDKGETDAIVLAKTRNADLLIIDELNGRKVAASFGLRIVGILGIVRDAKFEGFVQAIKPLLDDLRMKTTFRFSNFLYEKLLLDAGEK